MNGITDGTEFYALALFDTMPNGRAVYISIFAHRMDLLHICDAHDLLFIAMDLCVCLFASKAHHARQTQIDRLKAC